ncbi:pre-peptidase C-terminal domain-containing protein [Rheinheimera sp. 4Y26]|uniref:pre-peptidase C-terminal domain-containing protein n=1 Tax=Rheinheimera sp. 4Y26 TaxID=2977811 RepID=UPI0021B14D86|nr:pre-peptidase C-terminal domain-containing protein [Rheinheimera sp. 4Y26]MCT6698269.1 Type 1 glutamine amidotransferase-like domain-containing protein [Rheinheimera sp. 4Y26]
MKAMIKAVAMATLLSAAGHASAACLQQETENNNTEAKANSGLCSGQTVNGSIGSSSDIDWYKFDTTSSGDISVSLNHGSGADFDFYLYRSSGSYILSGQSSARPETGTYRAASAGTHFIKVSRYSGTGSYTLNVTFNGDGGGSTPPASCSYGVRPAKPSNLTSYLLGGSSDVCPVLTSGQGSLLLMGGGTDVDAAFSNRMAPQIKGGNIVVLRAAGTDAYNSYLQGLTGAASVETLIVDTQTKANSAYVEWAIKSAEAVFIAGGDQSAYLNAWQGTLVQSAIAHVYAKGGVVGGTSAGDHVLSQYVYDPDGVNGAISSEVVTDYCHNTINISSNFLSFPLLANTLNDTHFRQRDRMGRSAVFQAKLGQNGRVIAVSEATSLFVTADGQGIVDGTNEVYVLRADSQTQYTQTSCGQPVIIKDLLRFKLLPGDRFNLLDNSTTVTPIRIGIDGRNTSFYSPVSPY